MNIRIKGNADNISKKEVEQAAAYMVGRLLSKRISDKLIINISFKSKKKTKQFLGLTECLDDTYHPREFLLTIRKELKRKKMLSTLAHEIVHVKQFAKNEFNPAFTKWKKQFIDETVDYFEQPFEIEAFGREPGLVAHYLAYRKSQRSS